MIRLRETPTGTIVHFTNHPLRRSIPVTVVHERDGNVRLPDGSLLAVFDDECYPEPVDGLQ